MGLFDDFMMGDNHWNESVSEEIGKTHREQKKQLICSGWWFGTCFIFPYIGFLIITIDFHIFQRGGSTTNQCCSCYKMLGGFNHVSFSILLGSRKSWVNLHVVCKLDFLVKIQFWFVIWCLFLRFSLEQIQWTISYQSILVVNSWCFFVKRWTHLVYSNVKPIEWSSWYHLLLGVLVKSKLFSDGSCQIPCIWWLNPSCSRIFYPTFELNFPEKSYVFLDRHLILDLPPPWFPN